MNRPMRIPVRSSFPQYDADLFVKAEAQYVRELEGYATFLEDEVAKLQREDYVDPRFQKRAADAILDLEKKLDTERELLKECRKTRDDLMAIVLGFQEMTALTLELNPEGSQSHYRLLCHMIEKKAKMLAEMCHTAEVKHE